MTRDLGLNARPGAVLATSMDAAFAYARQDAEKRGVDEIMVIGGSDVFAAAMPNAERLEITHVHAKPARPDFPFPPIDPQSLARKPRAGSHARRAPNDVAPGFHGRDLFKALGA